MTVSLRNKTIKIDFRSKQVNNNISHKRHQAFWFFLFSFNHADLIGCSKVQAIFLKHSR